MAQVNKFAVDSWQISSLSHSADGGENLVKNSGASMGCCSMRTISVT